MHTCVACDAERTDDTGPVTRCADCGSRTMSADELKVFKSIRDDLAHETFKPVRVFDGPADRALISAIFEDEGVPFVVRGGGMFSDVLSAQYDASVVPGPRAAE
jgi:hypothetical protein